MTDISFYHESLSSVIKVTAFPIHVFDNPGRIWDFVKFNSLIENSVSNGKQNFENLQNFMKSMNLCLENGYKKNH